MKTKGRVIATEGTSAFILLEKEAYACESNCATCPGRCPLGGRTVKAENETGVQMGDRVLVDVAKPVFFLRDTFFPVLLLLYCGLGFALVYLAGLFIPALNRDIVYLATAGVVMLVGGILTHTYKSSYRERLKQTPPRIVHVVEKI